VLPASLFSLSLSVALSLPPSLSLLLSPSIDFFFKGGGKVAAKSNGGGKSEGKGKKGTKGLFLSVVLVLNPSE
jgi:hypothetical protein